MRDGLFGAHAPYVWGAVGAVALGIALELLALWRSTRALEKKP
jgi:heme exporter protein CcmD